MDFFSGTYKEARERFLQMCASHGATIRSYMQEQLGKSLSYDVGIDTARFGPSRTSKTLVLIAGTHGVEGFCGSACQIAAVSDGICNSLPIDTSLFLIHGLNPYGFAMLRRVDAENIDLNRNFVEDFEALNTYNVEYDRLNAALNPKRWHESDPQDGDEEILAFIKAEGMKKFQELVSIGQYRHPKGLFFGGRGKAWSRIKLEMIIRDEFQNNRSLAVIDYHTGLGQHGVGELISFALEDSVRYKRLVEWFGPAVKSTKSQATNVASVSADVGGPIENAFLCADRIVDFVALEFGTVPIPAVLRALRAENCLTHYGDPGSTLGKKIKEELKSAFYPTDQAWKATTLGRSKEILQQAIAGIAKT
jgi:hypothetical protein